MGGRSFLMKETEIYDNWRRFVRTGQYDRDVIRPIIAESWKISKNAGIDPYEPIRPKKLSKKEFQKRFQRASQVIEISLPFMESIYKIVAKSEFVVRLTDRDGYILITLGEDDTLGKMKTLNIQPGECCREDVIGTNAIGISIRTGEPVQVFAAEHYNFNYHGWTTSSCPIKDETGRVIAALSMTGYSQKVHSHTLGMVIAAAEAIESQMRLKESNRQLALANKHFMAIMESISEGLICIDNDLTITDINQYAKKMLNITNKDPVGEPLTKLFGNYSKKIREVLRKGKGYNEEETIIDIPRGTLRCVIYTTPIKQDNSTVDGAVITIREGKSVHNLVNKIVGAEARFVFDDILGNSPAIIEAKKQGMFAAQNSNTVLLTGESGTGKELFAQAVHNASERKDGPFVFINCGAIPRELIASELFGYVEGAFTGARRGGHPGKFELADGGTIFLDEIGDMPLDTQANLLRVLENKEVVRIGSHKVIPVDVRVIAATHKDLEKEVERGNFRQDLYFRLNVIRIHIPPLRERQEDIRIFIDKLIGKYSEQLGKPVKSVSKSYYKIMLNYSWPGNVREMQNVINQSIMMMEGNELTSRHIPQNIERKIMIPEARGQRGIQTLEEIEKRAIQEALEFYGGNITKAAKSLGIGRNTLYRKINKLNIEYVP